MYATQIRPVTDLRNRYPEVESDLERGPVSISLFDKLMAKQALYEAIEKSEAEIDAGQELDAKAALAKMRSTLHV